MKSTEEREDEITQTVEMADIYLRNCKDTLIMTSRELITGKSKPFLIFEHLCEPAIQAVI